MDMVREAQKGGYLIGSCSDRTVSNQQRIWKEHGFEVAFTVLKHQLGELITRFQAEENYHIGDTDLDRHVSQQAGFRFIHVDEAAGQFWGQ